MTSLPVSRRTALRTAAAGGIAMGGIGGAAPVYAQPLVPTDGGSSGPTVAAIQTSVVVSDLASVVQSVATQVDADLFIVNGGPTTDITGLVRTARGLQRHIALSMTGEEGLVLLPDGTLHLADDRKTSLVQTTLGQIAFGLAASADLAILRQSVGYDRKPVSSFCREHQSCVVAITEATGNAAPAESATAIFGTDGRVLTQTAPHWSQAIAAVLPGRRSSTLI